MATGQLIGPVWVARHVILRSHPLCVALWRPAGASTPGSICCCCSTHCSCGLCARTPPPAQHVLVCLRHIPHTNMSPCMHGCTPAAGASMRFVYAMGGDHPHGASGWYPRRVCSRGSPSTRVGTSSCHSSCKVLGGGGGICACGLGCWGPVTGSEQQLSLAATTAAAMFASSGAVGFTGVGTSSSYSFWKGGVVYVLAGGWVCWDTVRGTEHGLRPAVGLQQQCPQQRHSDSRCDYQPTGGKRRVLLAGG